MQDEELSEELVASSSRNPNENEQGLLMQEGLVIEWPHQDQPARAGGQRGGEFALLRKLDTFELVRGTENVEFVTVPVPCPLPLYRKLTVQYRTNNRARYMRERPTYHEPTELKRLKYEYQEAIKRRTEQAEGEFDEELDLRIANLDDRLTAMAGEVDDKWVCLLARWSAGFVKRIDGWDYTRSVHDKEYDTWGEEAIELDPHRPETYEVLALEFEDLFNWLIGDGYREALAQVSGPFGTRSANTSTT